MNTKLNKKAAAEFEGTTDDFAKIAAQTQGINLDEIELQPARFTFEKNVFPVAIEFRRTTIWVGDPEKPHTLINSEHEAKAAIHAALYLARGNVYGHIEPGLHLLCTKAQLFNPALYMQNVGVLSSAYVVKGEKDPFAALKPETGFVWINAVHSAITAYPAVWHEFVKTEKQEPKNWGRDRAMIALHGNIDAILLGTSCFVLQPNFYRGDRGFNDGDMLPYQRQEAWVARYKAISEMSDDDARKSYIGAIANKNYWRGWAQTRSESAAAKADGKDPYEGMTLSVPLRDSDGSIASGRMGTFETLNGAKVRCWYRKAGLNNTVHTIDEAMWPDFVKMVAERHYNVEVLSAAQPAVA